MFPEIAPDLAVEVLSPSDRLRQVLDKVGECLEAGVRLVWVIDPVKLDAGVRVVWVIDPGQRRAAAYRAMTSVQEIGADGEFDGADVLPGFRCRLSELLD